MNFIKLKKLKKFPFYKQLNQMDCGPTCVRMIGKHYGRNLNLQYLRQISGINRDGVSLLGISDAAEKIGFRTMGVSLSLEQIGQVELPVILHWNQSHFVVLYRISKSAFSNKHYYFIADPAKGLIKYSESELLKHWIGTSDTKLVDGITLILTPGPDFFDQKDVNTRNIRLSYLWNYLRPYNKLLGQILIGLFVGSLLQLILPVLAQAVVDIGINTRNINFVFLILIAQGCLLLGRISVDFLRTWILLHISTRVSINILTDFLIKLMKLPISFFDTKMTGDIMQRMSDQGRIQVFLTGSSLNTIFSMTNLLIFGVVLSIYDIKVFLIYAISSIIYSLWVFLFLNRRRNLDFKRFDVSSKSQNNVVQLIAGMQEIKLNNSELQKRWEWEAIQAELFNLNIKGLALGQYQQIGSFVINEGKNILITYIVAKSVINGDLTLGAMIAIQYILGQLNTPIEQLLTFLQQFQDAKISLERLSEIHEMDDEEPVEKTFLEELPDNKTISIQNVEFTYPGADNEPVLKDITLNFPQGKTTAIVGASGSGKTSIFKLLLRFYDPVKGKIFIGGANLKQISYSFWRSKCGTVSQDGFIFSDTILYNIVVGQGPPDINNIRHAVQVANLESFLEKLPLGLNTKIGASGNGLSQGQKQRILIARAVYKNPEYIFFDEATNALDATNEMVIMKNLEVFFKSRTVVVVAHRLSTVKNADNIIVLGEGKIVENGTHQQLLELKGAYYNLIENQLQLSL